MADRAPTTVVSTSLLLDVAALLHLLKQHDPFDIEYHRLAKQVDEALHRAANPPPPHRLRVVPPAAHA